MTTRVCPECGSSVVVPLHSINMKICVDCKTEYPWPLDAGQTPTMTKPLPVEDSNEHHH